MTAFVLTSIVVAVIDQAVKLLVRARLRALPLSLGPFGDICVVSNRIWMMRGSRVPGLLLMWALWVVAAVALAMLSARAPRFSVWFGLMTGGALSHALETSWRGSIVDYIRLRFWPAFNLADVALVIGAAASAILIVANIA
jgi:lipoprotein signal peptidase